MQYLSSLHRVFLVALLSMTLGLASAYATPDNAPDETVTITPNGDQMEFEQDEFTVQSGQTIELTFQNTANSPAMKHNVLILNTDDATVVDRVGQAALSESDFIPDDDAVIAATDVADPGETVSVTFTAPSEPGTYTYVCTFPGHYSMMQGTMIVQ